MTFKSTLLFSLTVLSSSALTLPNSVTPLQQTLLDQDPPPCDISSPETQMQQQDTTAVHDSQLGIHYGQCYNLIHPDLGPIVDSTWGAWAQPWQLLTFKEGSIQRRFQVCRNTDCESGGPVGEDEGFYLRDLSGSPKSQRHPAFLAFLDLGAQSQLWPYANDNLGRLAVFQGAPTGNAVRLRLKESAHGFNGLHVNSNGWPGHSYVFTDRQHNGLTLGFKPASC
ncbi:uncharacterized protein BO95DRAFT_504911 [Aspergillus brunneoviolaceus CBS 621.78]|uniref:Uncharacterized protein n=1 Tax=Aspergillus brunneoviolaceus CBS 621.78 TaxID=1450534 RepID=A0ACD1GKB2_9EURO|nr:hypothetical protein BO95DRAFT_504911 [Aspergillus brunneoviolaceus CBS 621.78]RAH49734.1 hypothetical protein BO95DRAFT_504911 [Aspergillus brunneoviolaceus CBS 621.78]